jgi:hypothetical protein
MSLFDDLLGALSGNEVDRMAQNVNADKNQVANTVQAALPLLLGALNRNSNDNQGALNLANALDRDHDGDVLDDIAGFLDRGPSQRDQRIADHVFGGRRDAVAQRLSGSTGLDSGSVMQIIGMLAPLVMGALGKQKRQRGLDATGLSDLLTRETDRARQRNSGGMNMVEMFLDSDRDGDITDDVFKIGGDLLGGLFNKRR